MKVHQLARGLIFEHEPSLSLGCKRLRPLAPRLTPAADTVSSLDLKSFIRPESGPRRLFTDDRRSDPPPPPQVETHPGGTRWNPTQEQIGILEMLYRQGMRTPNAQQIEQITAQLGKYGKIEGKNVFYWFQNHKARERQKQKRSNTNTITTTAVTTTPPPLLIMTPTSTPSTNISFEAAAATNYMCSGREREESSPYKRKCRSWSFESLEEDQSSRSTICKENDNNDNNEEEEEEEEERKKELRTLELFPLHPEAAADGRS